MSELTTVARPYAQAAFDFAVEKQVVEQWQQMLSFAAAVTQDEVMSTMLTSSMSADKMAELFSHVCEDHLDQHGQNFVRVLADNERLVAIPQISRLFDALKAEYDKEIEVVVTSATELDDAQQKALSQSLEQRLSRKIKLYCSVDESLIAGMVIKAGDTVIDGSVKTKLSRLSDALQA